MCSLKNFNTNIHTGVIYNSQEVETAQTATKRWINKMKYTHTMDHY